MPLRRHGSKARMARMARMTRMAMNGDEWQDREKRNTRFSIGVVRPLVRQPPYFQSSPPVLLSVAKKPTARSDTTQACVKTDELASLAAIATAQGVTTSEIVRRLVRAGAGLPSAADPEMRPARPVE